VARSQLSGLLKKENAALAKMAKAFIDYKSNKNLQRFKEEQSSVFAIVDSCHTSILELANQSVYGPDFQTRCKALVQLLKERSQLIKKHQDQVMNHFDQESKGAVTDEKRQKLSQTLAENEEKLEELQQRISQLQK
jgi:gas vesicle protein